MLEMASLESSQAALAIRAGGLSPQIVAGLSQWGSNILVDGEHITLDVPRESLLPEITRYLVAQGADVYAITPKRMSLEEIFIETVGKDGGL